FAFAGVSKRSSSRAMKAGTDTLVNADKLFNAARSAQQTAYDDFRPADEALTEWLGKASAT
ncbi:MAG: hypothetical protein DLM52_06335, partial [Chthoniobacterales bacterium]